MKANRQAQGINKLIEAISASPNDPNEEGPEVVIIELTSWNGQTVTGSRVQGKPANIATDFEHLWHDKELLPLVRNLVEKGVPFVTSTKPNGNVCILEWTISSAEK